MINIYDTRSLTNAVNKTVTTEPFVLNTLFKNKQFHAADVFDFEAYSWQNKLAKFVPPSGEPHTINKKSRQSKTLKIPRTFERKIFDAKELADYQELGKLWVLSQTERDAAANKWVLDEITNLKDRVIATREWMACQAISTGSITVAQTDIAFTIDFGLTTAALASGGHIYTLANADKWSANTSSPSQNIRDWVRYITSRTGKSNVKIIVGNNAAKYLLTNTEAKAQLDNLNYQIGKLTLNDQAKKYGNYIGTLAGCEVYEYNQLYVDADGNKQDMIGANKAIAILDEPDYFKTHWAPVYRVNEKGLQSNTAEFLLSSHINNYNTALEWMLEQKSLPAIHNPDALIIATVC